MSQLITPVFLTASGARAPFLGFSEDMHAEVADHAKKSIQSGSAVFCGRSDFRPCSQRIEEVELQCGCVANLVIDLRKLA